MSSTLPAASVPPDSDAMRLDDKPAGRAPLLPDQIRTLFQQTPASLAGNLLGAVIISAMFWSAVPWQRVALWSALFAAVWLVRAVHFLRYPKIEHDLLLQRRWLSLWNAYVLLSSSAWGAAVLMFYGTSTPYHTVALIIVVYSYMLAAVQFLATQPRVYLSFLSLGLVPMVVRTALADHEFHLELAGIMSLLFLTTALTGRNYRQAFETTIRLKVRTEQLAAQLRTEKALAEQARREAEVANRAKTQFFAAASHDLRQPLHAMGLFAEALRGKSHGDDEVMHLVNSINSSVDALEGLFSELLDITRIDTGAVELNPEHFTLRDLFKRLKLQYEPTAFEKGLSLHMRGERLSAHADPVLVDRIVRNLLSNAIRYTEDGGVLLTARARGDRVLVQVWDTGIGISQAEQLRIFDEFYQVRPGKPLNPEQRKGLGLGLSICKRLADMMGAPLALSSVPGRGTVFTLTLPRGKVPASQGEAQVLPKAPIGLTLDHRTIVIVEDEPAVREGLVVLLRGWGASAIAFDTVADAREWAAQARVAPDLLIVDYRLSGGETGIDALAAVRRSFQGRTIPAIMVTGSVMNDYDAAAHEHDFHLLMKPVVPNKLRAMIAFKLGMR